MPYTGEQGGGVLLKTIIDNVAGFMIHSWIKEAGLANLGRSSLGRGTVFRP